MHSFIGEKNANRNQNKNGQPHSKEDRSNAFFGKFFTKNIQQVKNNEENNGGNQWHAKATFSYNGA